MRRRHTLFPAIAAAAVCVCASSAQSVESEALRVLEEARQALGGGTALSAVTAFTIEGSLARAIMPGRLVSNPFSFECILPDKFVLVTHAGSHGPIAFSTTDFAGFSGSDLIRDHRVVGNPPMPTFIPDPRIQTASDAVAARARLVAMFKRQFVKVVVPLFAQSPSTYPLTFENVRAEAGGSVIVFTTPDAVRWELLIDATSHLPLTLTWMETPPVVVSAPAMVAVGPNGRIASASTSRPEMPAANAPARWELAMSDYRRWDTVNWPTRMTTTVGGVKTEEWKLSRIKINPRINEKDFLPRDRRDD